MQTSLDREKVREQYRPRRPTLLFVGESPPSSGKFFYFGSGIVFASTKRAFAQAFHRSFSNSEDFFHFFGRCGCYLDDISHDAIDDLPVLERKQAINGCIDSFAQRLRDYKPDAIIVFLKRIASPVTIAASLANIPREKLMFLPFPGNGHQNRYVAELVAFLEQAIARNQIAYKGDPAS
jgi:hypothetical protein